MNAGMAGDTLEQPSFDLHQIYRAVEIIAKEADSIQASLFSNLYNEGVNYQNGPDVPSDSGSRKAYEPDFHGESFSSQTHRSKTDPDASLFCK